MATLFEGARTAEPFEMQGHKLFWHLDRVNDWAQGKRIAPLYIDMGITQTCNIHCQYCYYAVPENRTKHVITTERLVQFLKEAGEIGVKAIGFLGDGEPMVHPGCYDAVIAGHRFGIDMAISTNGTVMEEARLPDFLRALTWIRFNISAAEPEKYGLVMGTSPKMFQTVRRNMARCVEIKKQLGLQTTIGMQMVLVQDCVDQVVPLARLGRELGVDYVVVKQCSEHGSITHGLIPEDYAKHEELYQEAESFATADYHVVIKRTKMANKKRSYDRCFGCDFLPQITGAGEVYVCGNWFGHPDFLMGNINTQSFKEIVFSDRYQQVQKKVNDEVDVHKQCGIGCRQNEINEFLWKLKHPPKHINFI